jgi:hypothetical protein
MWAGGMAQVVYHLPGTCEALSSNSSTTKIKKQNKQKRKPKESDDA